MFLPTHLLIKFYGVKWSLRLDGQVKIFNQNLPHEREQKEVLFPFLINREGSEQIRSDQIRSDQIKLSDQPFA